MSMNYGSYKPYYGPTGRVDFGWLSEAWDIFKRTWSVWVSATLIYGVITLAVIAPFEYSIFTTAMRGAMTPSTTVPYTPPTPGALPPGFDWRWILLMSAGTFLINLFLSSSFLRLALKAVRRLPVTLADAFSGGPVVWRMFLFAFPVTFFGTVGGYMPMLTAKTHPVMGWAIYGMTILLYIVLNPLLMAAPAIIADGGGPWQAFTESIGAMKRSFPMALLFIIVGGLLLVVLSVVTCYLGFLVTIPMAYVIIVLAYRDMVGMDGIQEPNFGYAPMYAPPPTPGVWPPPPGAPPTYGQQQPPYPGPPPGQYPPQPPQGYDQQPQPGTYPPPSTPGYGQPPPTQDPPNADLSSEWPNQPPGQ